MGLTGDFGPISAPHPHVPRMDPAAPTLPPCSLSAKGWTQAQVTLRNPSFCQLLLQLLAITPTERSHWERSHWERVLPLREPSPGSSFLPTATVHCSPSRNQLHSHFLLQHRVWAQHKLGKRRQAPAAALLSLKNPSGSVSPLLALSNSLLTQQRHKRDRRDSGTCRTKICGVWASPPA